MFTDEDSFCVNSIDDKEKLHLRQVEHNAHVNFSPNTVSFLGSSIIVQNGVCLEARTKLVVIDGRALAPERHEVKTIGMLFRSSNICRCVYFYIPLVPRVMPLQKFHIKSCQVTHHFTLIV